MVIHRPFPLDAPSVKTFRYTFYAALCVFMILILLQPFGINEVKNTSLVLNATLYALVTFVSTSINAFLLPTLFPTIYREEKWTVGKEFLHMCWQLVPISVGNWLLTHCLYGIPLTWHTLFNFFWITVVVGIFPLWLNVLLKQQRLLKKYQEGAYRLDEQLKHPEPQPQPTVLPEATVFTSDNGKEQFAVDAGNIRYITSADNYVRIFYVKGQQSTSHLLRNTLRKAEEVLAANPQFFRCHRAYIVNLSEVQHVSGNAQGFKLHLRDMEDTIPVSRNLNKQLSERLTQGLKK
ncbi:MAG TPA: LytTR family DNA-binding domain-containing protein [Niastella sp.]|nr:LytTR family DNA-binding domain-containing protein [Niastella sp.]